MRTDVSKPALSAAAAAELIDMQLRMLDELARMGRRMSEMLLAQFWNGTCDPVRSLLAHERMVRSVRHTMALRDQIQKDAARTALRRKPA